MNKTRDVFSDIYRSGWRKSVQSILQLFIGVVFITTNGWGQTYDLLLRNGQLIDPKNSINGKMDIAVLDGKVAKVAASIPSNQAKKIIDVTGLIVTPD